MKKEQLVTFLERKIKKKRQENSHLLFQLPNGVLGGSCKGKKKEEQLVAFLEKKNG
jgi:hypothetical protein